MTIHYVTVSENVLYEKWKNIEHLELFKVDTETNELIEVDLNSDTGENILEYEEEIGSVKKQIEISERCGRELWVEKNKHYLHVLEKTLEKLENIN
jgi:hypothetical protein